MPSFALDHYLDLDDVLCKRLLSLDLREASKTLGFPTSAVGYKKPGPPCTFSSSGTVSESTLMPSGRIDNWAQPKEESQPMRWNKTSFWSERAISMVEDDTGSLGWASTNLNHDRSTVPSVASCLPNAAVASSRYKTELCRTFTERGVCKYGTKCQFAHGPEELRCINRHPKYKTEPCRTFHSIGFCPYGIRCHFVHNNEDDNAHVRPRSAQSPTQRPPLLRQSFSFAGFPSSLRSLDPPLPQAPFLRVPSVSPPASSSSSAISDLLALAFPELSPCSNLDQVFEAMPQFLPSPDSGCSQGELTPVLSPSQLAPGHFDGVSRQSPDGNANLGSRSQSLASLSDHEGGCSSSASSLSGSDCSSAFDVPGRRLPIFSQLSVPDDSSCGEGDNVSFFL